MSDLSNGPKAEIDNLRAAHTWSLEQAEFESALRLRLVACGGCG